MDRNAISVAEYVEACASCRAHETNSRAILSAYAAIAIALVVLGWTVSLPKWGGALLFLIGFGMGWISIIIILRHRTYYRHYMARAKELEIELQMQLHSRVLPEVKKTGSSNKLALVGIVVFFCIYFFAGSIYYAVRS